MVVWVLLMGWLRGFVLMCCELDVMLDESGYLYLLSLSISAKQHAVIRTHLASRHAYV